MFDYLTRLRRLQELLQSRGIDGAVLSVGSDLPYFTGYTAMATERLTALVVPADGRATMYIPKLEAPRLQAGPFEVVSWAEDEDPVILIAKQADGFERISVGDHTWSVFLMRLQQALTGRSWSPSSELTRDLRMRKDSEEIASLRAAAEATDRVLARIPMEVVFSGRAERAVANDIAAMVVEEGHDASWFTLVASGANGASPHHEPGGRIIDSGDVVVCDFGGVVNGYHSDVTRTFVVGTPSSRQIEVHAVVQRSNEAGRSAIAPGVRCEEIDRASRQVIDEAGYGEYFIHRTGHGIGLEGHEHPYMIEGNDMPMESGMTFSVEPGIYLPGDFGVRIEDIVACGDSEVDDLNRAERGLVEVG